MSYCLPRVQLEPFSDWFQELFWWPKIETPLTFFHEQWKIMTLNTIASAQAPLRLVPEFLNAADMVFFTRKQLGMIDPYVMKASDVQRVI